MEPGGAAPTHADLIEELVENRESFNAFTYLPWRDALERLEERQGDEKLHAYVEALLPQGKPAPMHGKKSIVLFRHVATPNYEVCRFLIAANALEELHPLILEYTEDKFNNRNDWKFSLAKLRFHKGTNRLGDAIFESRNIIDINQSNNKPISAISTHWGQSLVDFHHELFGEQFPSFKDNAHDLSEWLHELGPTAEDYYKGFLSLFLKDAVLFENFLLDVKEAGFTRDIILPAILELEAETGHRPLIVALEPTEIEGDHFWLSHAPERLKVIDSKTAS